MRKKQRIQPHHEVPDAAEGARTRTEEQENRAEFPQQGGWERVPIRSRPSPGMKREPD